MTEYMDRLPEAVTNRDTGDEQPETFLQETIRKYVDGDRSNVVGFDRFDPQREDESAEQYRERTHCQ